MKDLIIEPGMAVALEVKAAKDDRTFFEMVCRSLLKRMAREF